MASAGRPAASASSSCRGRRASAAGLQVRGRDREPLEHRLHPAVRVLPAVAVAEHEDRAPARLELPQDVAGPEPAADAERHRLRQRLAGVAGDHSVVGEHVGDCGGVGMHAAAQAVAVVDTTGRPRRPRADARSRSARRFAPCGRGCGPSGACGRSSLSSVASRPGSTRPCRGLRRRSDSPSSEDIDPLCLRTAGRRGRPVRRSGAEERRADPTCGIGRGSTSSRRSRPPRRRRRG